MKVVKIKEETHQYLMMQRAMTGVPAGKQVDNIIKEFINAERKRANFNERPIKVDRG